MSSRAISTYISIILLLISAFREEMAITQYIQSVGSNADCLTKPVTKPKIVESCNCVFFSKIRRIIHKSMHAGV